MPRSLNYARPLEDMADVEDAFYVRIQTDISTTLAIKSVTTEEQFCYSLGDPLIKSSEASAFHIRINGIRNALSNIKLVIQNAHIAANGQCESWQAMLWGSLSVAIKQFRTHEVSSKATSCLPYLGLLEDLITLTSLPTPANCWDSQQYSHFKSTLLNLVAELACGILNVALFLLENPAYRRRIDGEKFLEFQTEHQRTASRLKCLTSTLNQQMSGISGQCPTAAKFIQQSAEHLPVHIQKHFLGRDLELQNMHAILTQAKETPAVLSLYGLAGIGKTQLAAKYCMDWKCMYPVVFWIDADTTIKVRESFSKYATRHKLPDSKPFADSATNAEVFLSWLQSCDMPWIIVFDNVDEVDILKDYWPYGGRGHIIITHRNPYAAQFRTSGSIHVQPLDRENSKALFYKIVGQEKLSQHTPEIEALFQEWGGVPLALSQMGSYVHRRKLDLQRFPRLYTASAQNILETRDDIGEYPHSLVTAFAIQDIQGHAKALLHGVCFLDPGNIPSELLLSSFDEDKSFHSIDSEFQYHKAVETLCKRALLEQKDDNMSVHRLVHSVVYNSMTSDERKLAFEAVLSLLLRRFPREVHGKPLWNDRQRCASYLPHVMFLCNRHSSCLQDCKSIDLAELLSACTWYMFEQGLFSGAEALLDRAQNILPDSSDNLTVASLYFSLAGIRCECNRIAESKQFCERTLNIREKMLASDDPLLGNTYYSIAIVYMEHGQISEALEYNKKAVALHERCSKHDGSPTAFSYGNLGLCYLAMGQLDLASEYMEKSESLWSASCGKSSDRYAIIMYYLGNLRLAQGRGLEAKEYHTTALNILQAVTPDHFKTGLSYHKLACFFYDEGCFGKSIEYLEKAIGIFSKQFDPAPRVARSLYKKYEVYQAAGDLKKAEEVRWEAEALRRSIKTIPYDEGPAGLAFDRLVPSFLA